jgi:fatty acid-binding protein 3
MPAPPPSQTIPGKYQLTESKNFEEFMARLGVGYVIRKLANKSKPLVTITEVEPKTKYDIKQESLVSTSIIAFNLGQEFDDVTQDGRKVREHKLSFYNLNATFNLQNK